MMRAIPPRVVTMEAGGIWRTALPDTLAVEGQQESAQLAASLEATPGIEKEMMLEASFPLSR
jgi:hypothetical protein